MNDNNLKNIKFADFSDVKLDENSTKWENSIARQEELYGKDYDLRNSFERDLHRIIHCNGYRRLKNKTQVFFAPHNDHICTRIEHVTHVSSVAETIAKFLNLNIYLVRAIANHSFRFPLDSLVKSRQGRRPSRPRPGARRDQPASCP